MKTIIIDPGHGGYDYGAVSGGRVEKADNLRLGLLVRDKLAGQSGIRTIMTRDSDEFISLSDRANISNQNGADIFVSLHRNFYHDPRANGVENFVFPGSQERTVSYARNVLNEVAAVGVQNNRGISEDDFYVLRRTQAPAQLLEMGFVSNEIDNEYFDRYIDSYAEAIARGIMTSLGLSYVSPAAPTDRVAVIKSIQTRLNQLYSAGLAVDGIYGPNTRRALTKGLQIELNNQYGAGLATDGIFGPATRSAIRSVRRGARGNIVYLLQAALFANGYNVGTMDGIFGRMTEEALLSFQADRGLTTDGIAGPATFSSLLSSI